MPASLASAAAPERLMVRSVVSENWDGKLEIFQCVARHEIFLRVERYERF